MAKGGRVSRVILTLASGAALVGSLAPQVALRAAAFTPSGGAVVTNSTKNDVSPPLRSLSGEDQRREEARKGNHEIRRHPHVGRQLPGGYVSIPGSGTTSTAIPTTSNSFDGVGQGFTGPQGTFSVNSAPPDPNGAVGPSNYVETVNTDFAVFDKAGTVLYGPVPINTIWSGFGGLCQQQNDGDPTVAYDKAAGRWVIQQFAITGANGTSVPFLDCVAVSQTGDPAGSYYRYSFAFPNFPDYPKLGVWADGYYLAVNDFNSSGTTFLGPTVAALDRNKMLSGQPATMQHFDLSTSYGSLLPADIDGSTPPPSGSPAYFAALDTSALDFWKFHVDWTTPANSTLSGPTLLGVAAYSQACNGGTCIPQSGTSQQLDSLGDRLMYRLAYRNFGDHESLVVNHSVSVNGTVGSRWYEIRNPLNAPVIYQSGTYSPDSKFRWMGSVAMDHAGDMALGFSESSTGIHPQIHYTGRLAGDALGTMSQGEASIIDGGGSQLRTLSRWGDYTSMAVDPSDDCTFWYTNEYLTSNGTFNWHTRVGSFKFSGCSAAPSDFSIAANPTSVSAPQGGSATSTISTSVTSGAAQNVTLSASGLPNGVSATFSPNPVVAGTSSTMTLTVAHGTATTSTPATITVTGTEAVSNASHATSVTLSSITASDFSISANPASLSVAQGGSGTSTISTAVTSGVSQSVTLSGSSNPAGPTVSFSSSSISSGGSATMTVSTGSSAQGTYTIKVTGTGQDATESTSVTLTVTAPAPSDFSISATAASAPQGGSGSSTVSTSITSGSTESVQLSTSNVPAGVTASFSVNPVNSGQSSTLNLAVGFGVAPGSYTVTVTGTAASGAHSTTFTLTVTASDFTITTSPNTLNIAQGSSGTSTVMTTVSSGAAQTVALSAGGQPSGAGVSFNPSSLQSGTSSTMTVAVAAATAVGSYTITVTGAGSTASHTTNVTLNVTTPAVVTNGGFETGNLSGWTASTGNPPKVVTTAHSGTYGAEIGSTSPYNGDSTLTQNVTIPSGNSKLSFWYQPHCPDTITYDQMQMQIRSTAGSTLATVLNACTNTGTWTNVTFDTSTYAGQTVTLWFNDHDDGYAGDPTYFLIDDVAINPYTPAADAVTNGGFETGSLSGWTASTGNPPKVVTAAHTGTYGAQIGSASPYNGDSSLMQQVTVPSGSPTLTFWYQPHCPDTITYDQQQMKIRDTAGNVLATVLNVCSNSGAWAQVSFDMTPYAGKTVQLWFNDHDDGYATDPTYFFLDDVSLK